ncbi:MAG: hypothetical protein IT293_06270 [Deltaproteobacteria bacterium]|nr:hypothetical protein [Deltaproteobacteria bacterium]
MSDTNTEDRYGGFLQPNAILPVQFFQTLRSKGQSDGERRLMLAVLEDAVNCFMKQIHATDPKARRLFEDAEGWIAAEDRTWFFSFDNVCEALGLNPEYLRAGIFRWRAAERRRVGDAAFGDAVASCGSDATEDREADDGGLRLVNRL